jgi:hypothetical protein
MYFTQLTLEQFLAVYLRANNGEKLIFLQLYIYIYISLIPFHACFLFKKTHSVVSFHHTIIYFVEKSQIFDFNC